MVRKSRGITLLVFLSLVVFSLNLSSAEFIDPCFLNNSANGGTKTTCNNAGCIWASNDSSEFTLGTTDIYDPFCNMDDTSYCCFPDKCWQFDNNETACNLG